MAEFNNFQELLNPNDQNEAANRDGFRPPNAPAANGIGLPYKQVPYGVSANYPTRRKLIHWLIPDMGVVKMYVNPEQIQYNNSKLINKERTKGGFNLQYWGEDLTTLSISGTTGTAGVEGINMLYEIYRSEQYTFDPIGLNLGANSYAANGIGNLVNQGLGALGSKIGGINGGGAFSQNIGSSIAQGFFGANNISAMSPRNIPTLANNAFTLEMYYDGWVFRGYINRMTFTESASDFLFRYNMDFIVTQRRGYRTNYMPWHKSPIEGGGDQSNETNQVSGEGIPYSYRDFVKEF